MGQHKAGKPVRIIVLKSRRMGVSTHLQARFVHSACTTLSFHGITGAHLDESSQYLHGMAEHMIHKLPAAIRPTKQTGIQGKRIVFDHGSSLRTFTAGGRDSVGRATGANGLHGSEVAFWPDAKGTLAALLQIIPRDINSIVVLESTANGVGNEFHTRWNAAVNGDGSYLPFFAAWFEFPDYVLSDEETQRIMGSEPELDDREEALFSSGVTLNQLAWRRLTIADECGGDPSIFDQEYPDSPAVAFLTSGRPFFPPDVLSRLSAVEPIRIGDLTGSPVQNGSIRLEARNDGAFRVWEVPKRHKQYIVFADVAGKVTLKEHQARSLTSKADYCAASVVDRESGAEVASYHARIDPDLYGHDLARIGRLYNDALIAVENTGGYGVATLAVLYRELGYGNLYKRRRLDTKDRRESESLGWDTSESTRPVMLDTLKARMRERPWEFKDEGFISEARTFVVNSAGRPAADSGCHDDRVMARAGALEVWREHAQSQIRIESGVKPRRIVEPADRRSRATRIAA